MPMRDKLLNIRTLIACLGRCDETTLSDTGATSHPPAALAARRFGGQILDGDRQLLTMVACLSFLVSTLKLISHTTWTPLELRWPISATY